MFEKIKEYDNFPICIFILFLANVFSFIYHNNVFGLEDAWITGVNYECVFHYGEFYRFFSAVFSHRGIGHLFCNMFCLWAFGARVEIRIGSLKTAGIYFLSGLGGSLLSMFGNHMLQPWMPHYSVGASGAIFGLVAAEAVLWTKEQGKHIFYGIFISFVYVAVSLFASLRGSHIFFSGRSALEVVFQSGIDVWGHIGGVIAGIAAALLFTRGYLFPEKERTAYTVLAVFITVLLSVAGGDGKRIMGKIGFENTYLKQAKELLVPGTTEVSFGDAMESYYLQPSWNIFPYKGGGSLVIVQGIEKRDISRKDILLLMYSPMNTRAEIFRLQTNGEVQDDQMVSKMMSLAVTEGAREKGADIDWEAYWSWKDEYVKRVWSGYPEGVTHVNYGKALEKYIASPCWFSFDSQGERVVQLTGECSIDGRKREASLQFLFSGDKTSFEPYSMELDGEPQSNVWIRTFLKNCCLGTGRQRN